MVTEWDIDGATNGCEVDVYGITADTADERLDEIEATIIKDLVDVSASDVVVCHGLDTYLRDVRDELPRRTRSTRPSCARHASTRSNGDHLAKLLGVNPAPSGPGSRGGTRSSGSYPAGDRRAEGGCGQGRGGDGRVLQGEEEPVLITYRDDEEFHGGEPRRPVDGILAPPDLRTRRRGRLGPASTTPRPTGLSMALRPSGFPKAGGSLHLPGVPMVPMVRQGRIRRRARFGRTVTVLVRYRGVGACARTDQPVPWVLTRPGTRCRNRSG
ncbi:hypothetical protein SANTM175S_01241 [Streptomyces antimycoticus]